MRKSSQGTRRRTTGTTLLLIDVQNDFHPGGSLAVPNSDQDAERIAAAIRSSIDTQKKSSSIKRIVATMDSHHLLHIAHPKFWVMGSDLKTNPQPFTIITSSEIKAGKWVPREKLKFPGGKENLDTGIMGVRRTRCYDRRGKLNLKCFSYEYTKALEAKGRFQLCIWPEHCLLGTRGHCIVDTVLEAMEEWTSVTGSSVDFVFKGENILTEMYSAIQSEVPISPETSFNQDLFEYLQQSDRILVAGQALSHCVNHTVRHLIDNLSREDRSKVYVWNDCSSPVPTFEKDGEDFLRYVTASGATVCKSTSMTV